MGLSFALFHPEIQYTHHGFSFILLICKHMHSLREAVAIALSQIYTLHCQQTELEHK